MPVGLSFPHTQGLSSAISSPLFLLPGGRRRERRNSRIFQLGVVVEGRGRCLSRVTSARGSSKTGKESPTPTSQGNPNLNILF